MSLSWSGLNLTKNLYRQFNHREECIDDNRNDHGEEACCGAYPARYPFNLEYNRNCCGSRTYNPMYYDCCPGNIVKLAGSC